MHPLCRGVGDQASVTALWVHDQPPSVVGQCSLIGYGPVLCAVTVDAFFKELRHADARWEKTEKIGRVLGDDAMRTP